jgi:hypothetical protein
VTDKYKKHFCVCIESQVWVAAATTIHWDLFNADASKIIRVKSVIQQADLVTAIATGVAANFRLNRTSAVGTGGTAKTPWPIDTGLTLDADVTCRSKPTGGATEGQMIRSYTIMGEETNAFALQLAALGGVELIPPWMREIGGLLIRPGTGLSCTQATSTALGQSSWIVGFTTEE